MLILLTMIVGTKDSSKGPETRGVSVDVMIKRWVGWEKDYAIADVDKNVSTIRAWFETLVQTNEVV